MANGLLMWEFGVPLKLSLLSLFFKKKGKSSRNGKRILDLVLGHFM
jgi:hypothetical protein